MKKRTTNKLVMFQSVRTVLNDFQSEWQGLPVFVQKVNELDSHVNLLRNQLTQQNSITQGVTAAKNQRIMALREEMVLLQRALYLHGKASNNSLLQARNALSKTKLYLLNIAELMVRCNALKSDLENDGQNLVNYGIQTTTISAVISEFNALNDIQNSTRIAILKRSNAAFYQAYHYARLVPHSGKQLGENNE